MNEEEKNVIDTFKQGYGLTDAEQRIILNLIEKQQNKIQALEKQHKYDMQMIDEVKGNAVKWADELEQEKEKNSITLSDLLEYKEELAIEKEKNKSLKKQIKEMQEYYKNADFIFKDKLKSFFEDKITYRQFELQQEYKDFKDDVRLNTLQDIKEEILEEE